MAPFHKSEGDGVAIRSVLAFLILFAGASVHAEPAWQADHSAPQFCLQNFNAYGPMYAMNVVSRTEKWTAELQAKPACAVVHLQEVWNQKHIKMVEHELSDRYRISAPNLQARIGIMSLFKGEVRHTETYSFHVNNEGGLLDGIRDAFNVKKAFHVVTARVETLDEDIFFINTHLHPTSSSVRITQLIDLLNWRLQNQTHKMILSGDFNATFDTLEHTFVTSLLQVGDSLDLALGGYKPGVCTYCKENRLGWLSDDRVFDYVFFSNVGSTNSELKVIDGTVNLRGTAKNPLSDHYGLRIQFSLEPKMMTLDFLTQELRRQKAVDVLTKAAHVLKSEKGAEFEPYKKELLQLVSQLQNHQGVFADYFSKSNY
jgi:endonuclease/exonuclease/phosphatase family metal-dependent hydrolase